MKQTKKDKIIISLIGYHEWMCGNSLGESLYVAYMKGYRAAVKEKRTKP